MNWRTRWVRFWDTREYADSLALVRILVPMVILWDLSQVWRLNLIRVLWAPVEEGGLGPASYEEPLIWFYQRYGATMHSTLWLYGLTVAFAVMLMIGLFSRTSALALLLFYAQLETLSPDADRGIDTLLRNVMCILVFSRAGATFSVDARLRYKTFVSDVLVPAWPRYLVIMQLVILYFFAGLAKDAASWSFRGSYVALFYVLHEPHHARFLIPHEALVWAYPLTQIGTLTTVIWERSAVLLPLLMWLRNTRERGTKWHRWANKLRLLELWIGTGIFFHLMLATLLALGIFPWGCLALYPAFARPTTLRQWWSRLRAANFATASV
ncbi:MAG TPA: HTTM domain-containing protein [Polyangiales bacterium]